MRPRTLLLAALRVLGIAAVASSAVVAPVAAHHAGEAEILVFSEAIPGEPIAVTGSYLPEGVPLELRLVSSERSAVLASVTTDETGAFSADPLLPADFPTGPARLVALDASGTPVELELVVGRRPEASDPAGAAGGAPPVPAIVVLGILVAVAVGVGAYVASSRRS